MTTTPLAVAADNPFAKYAPKQTDDGNPFAKYATPQSAPAPEQPTAQESLGAGIKNLAEGAAGSVLGTLGDTYEAVRGALTARPEGFTAPPNSPAFAAHNQALENAGKLPAWTTSEGITNKLFGPATSDQAEQDRKAGRELLMAINPAGGLGAARAAFEASDEFKHLSSAASALKNAFPSGLQGRINRFLQKSAQAMMTPFKSRAEKLAEAGEAHMHAQLKAYFENKSGLEAQLGHINAHMEAVQRQAIGNGLTADEATKAAQILGQQKLEAQQGIAQLTKAALDLPQIPKADFVAKYIRPLTEQIAHKAEAQRKELAGFGKMLSDAGPEPRVDTNPVIDMVEHIKQVRNNPELEGALDQLFSVVKPAGENSEEKVSGLLLKDGRARLSVQQAHDARQRIDRIIAQRAAVQGVRLDEASLQELRNVRAELTESINRAWPQFEQADEKYRNLSSDMDLVARKVGGPLARAIKPGAYNRGYAMSASQVAGEVLKATNDGSPLFAHLLAEDPGFADAARGFYNWTLFGKESLPSESQFATFLRDNEKSLQQTGLLDEYKTLHKAQQTARESLAAIDGRLKEAGQAAKEATRQRAALSAQDADRARGIQQQLAEMDKKAKVTRVALKTFHDIKLNLQSTRATRSTENISAQVYKLLPVLKDNGVIDESEYTDIRKELQAAKDEYRDQAEFRRRVTRLALLITLTTMGWVSGSAVTWYMVKGLFGH